MTPSSWRSPRAARSSIALVAVLLASLVAAPATWAAGPTPRPDTGLLEPGGQPPRVASSPPVARSGFQDIQVFSGLQHPTNIAFAPDGRIFVAEKAGRVEVFDSLTDTIPSIWTPASLLTNVYDYWDRGLLGMTVGGGYVYVLYTYNHRLGDASPPPLWVNDGCPTPPGPTTNGCVASARLSRFPINADGSAGAEQALVEDWCQQFPSHSVGDVRIGPDGYLYVSAGEAASFSGPDKGDLGGNPCGDPVDEGGSLRSQSSRRPPAEPRTLDGTLLRLDPATGLAAPGNANIANPDPNMRRIIDFGLRNPFRFNFRPGSSEIWVGDVGESYWEEIDRVMSPTAGPSNFGWPCYEGTEVHPSFKAFGVPLCDSLYPPNPPTTVEPFYTYYHYYYVAGDTACSYGNGSAISGMAFYNGGSYPGTYKGALFFADHQRLCIWAMLPQTPGGVPDPTNIQTLVSGAAGPVDLEIGPAGDLFYVDYDGGTVHRLKYIGPNGPPTAVAKATPTSGAAPLTVTFDGTGSHDPEFGPLTYDWHFGDGSADATAASPVHTFGTGTFTVTLTVTDQDGATGTDSLTISSSNHPPVPRIATPSASLRWSVGQLISFSGSATDVEDGTIPPARLSWTLVIHHCIDPTHCHTHDIQTWNGIAGGSFNAPDHEYPSRLELQLTATDSNGISATASLLLDPSTVNLTFTSSPSGAALTVGTGSSSAPFTRTVIVNSRNTVIAPSSQTLGGYPSTFVSWSDGGARIHDIVASATAHTYEAFFNPAEAADTCAAAAPTRAGAWLTEKIDVPGDVDWFQFTVPRTGYASAVLGRLDADLRLDLYSSCSTLVASSQQSGTTYEAIYGRLAAGTYRLKVSGVGGAVSTAPYSLRFQNLLEQVQVDSSTSWAVGGQVTVVGSVLNNTSSPERSITVRADLFDAANRNIGSVSTAVYASVLNPRARAPFRMTFSAPAGYHHYTLVVTGIATTTPALGGLIVTTSARSYVLTPGARMADLGGRLHVVGTLQNRNAFSIRSATVAVTLFDNLGNVINVVRIQPASTTLAPGASTTFDAVLADHFGTLQVVSVRPDAVR